MNINQKITYEVYLLKKVFEMFFYFKNYNII
jgi:hypothetical protein